MNFDLILFNISGCSILDEKAVNFIYKIIDLIKNITPVILIIMGVFELGKAAISQKSDEMNKAKTNFIIKLVSGILVFFVIIFIQWITKVLGTNTSNDMLACLSDVMNGTYSAFVDHSEVLCDTSNKCSGSSCTGVAYDYCMRQVEYNERMSKLCTPDGDRCAACSNPNEELACKTQLNPNNKELQKKYSDCGSIYHEAKEKLINFQNDSNNTLKNVCEKACKYEYNKLNELQDSFWDKIFNFAKGDINGGYVSCNLNCSAALDINSQEQYDTFNSSYLPGFDFATYDGLISSYLNDSCLNGAYTSVDDYDFVNY